MHRAYYIILILLLSISCFATEIDDMRAEMAKRLKSEMSYLTKRAENPRVYQAKYKKLPGRSRAKPEILNLEAAFDSNSLHEDSISSGLAAPKRKKHFSAKKRTR
jgi:hypothetical protein